jgi:hypothetical protein
MRRLNNQGVPAFDRHRNKWQANARRAYRFAGKRETGTQRTGNLLFYE